MVYVCDICTTEEEADDFHLSSPEHRFNYALKEFECAKQSLVSNRHGVELDVQVVPLNGFRYDFNTRLEKGCYYLNISSEKFKNHKNKMGFLCKISNKRKINVDPVVMTYCSILHPYKAFSMEDPTNQLEQFKQLDPGAAYSVIVSLTLDESHIGNYKIPIYFSFQTLNTANDQMQSFSIARSIIVAIHDDLVLEESINEKSPFKMKIWEKCKVIKPKHNFPRTPDQFPIPERYKRALLFGLNKDANGVLEEILRKLEPKYPTLYNYADLFHIMLWLEETCSIIGLSCYNMENVTLKYQPGDVLQLVVPGLAEKRPSIVKGDIIEIKVHGDHTSYQGVIQQIEDQTVHIFYLDDIILNQVCNNPNIEIDVRFIMGRIHFERMHIGVDRVFHTGYVKRLFPDENLTRTKVTHKFNLSQNALYNKQIYNNPEQLTAVINIVSNTSRGAPYLVYGPPGTGKTVTIVEAIYQLKQHTKDKIMICAPSNAACNMLTEKLAVFCSTNELKRIMSDNADMSSVHKSINNYCNLYVDSSGTVVIPVRDFELQKYRIIVTTLVRAGKYTGIYQPDVLFIDEAAQAREPEACCAIGLLLANKRLILAGDPQQLGPVIHSEKCKEYGYDISIFERLWKLPLYQNNPDFMTMLKLNFRSHPEILKIPNEYFYKNQLKAVSTLATNDPLCGIFVYKLIVNDNKLVKRLSPIEFCSVLSKEQRQGKSPSFYNMREILMVYKYVEKLTSIKFQNPKDKVTPEQIGVVTPYIRQVYKIRECLKNHNKQFKDVEVGTTEAFQGREKRVIIISTVRAQEDLLLFDKKYKLGFVKEPKRFNVAVTRARSKLILIGNPLVLHSDSKFRSLMNQAKELGTLCGAPFKPRSEQMRQDISNRVKKVHLSDVTKNKSVR